MAFHTPTPNSNPSRSGAPVLDTHIDSCSWPEAIQKVIQWGDSYESRYVTFCNVHSVVTASQDDKFRTVINGADLALPDGAPIAWALRRQGHTHQQRINGPDFTWKYLAEAERTGQAPFFFGSTPETLEKLRINIKAAFPNLKIAGLISPPFRQLSHDEEEAYVKLINESKANVVFVGLGCPKQETWMAAHRGKIKAVMLGVGAAFDYHAGTIQRGPEWMQRYGLEWLHRLWSEPNRLAKRYASTNAIFIYRMLKSTLSR